MNAPRWLLPFTYGVDMRALDAVVGLAGSARATLVPVSLISVPHEDRSRGARLEHIQQSKDFLEALQFKAARLEVPVERYEVFTGDVLQSIAVLVRELHCDSIVLVSTGNRDVLLHASELKRLVMEPPASLVLIRLPARTQSTQAWRPGDRLLSWLRRLWGYQDDSRHTQDVPTGEEPSWMRVEEPHRG
jgi:nucleotide-binding universal stress UspA family protein